MRQFSLSSIECERVDQLLSLFEENKYIYKYEQWGEEINLSTEKWWWKSKSGMPGRCGRVVNTSACQAGGLWFKSSNLPLLKHACGESDWLLYWLYTLAEVLHQRWISGNVYHVCLHKVWIRQNPPWLWNPEETSPEVWNRGISGPENGHVSNKNFKKNKL